MPEPKKYRKKARRVYGDKEHRVYSSDPVRQEIADKYINEPVIPIEEVVVTPKYRTLPENSSFRRPGETSDEYYRRMAVQEGITPDGIEDALIGPLAGAAMKAGIKFMSPLLRKVNDKTYRALMNEGWGGKYDDNALMTFPDKKGEWRPRPLFNKKNELYSEMTPRQLKVAERSALQNMHMSNKHPIIQKRLNSVPKYGIGIDEGGDMIYRRANVDSELARKVKKPIPGKFVIEGVDESGNIIAIPKFRTSRNPSQSMTKSWQTPTRIKRLPGNPAHSSQIKAKRADMLNKDLEAIRGMTEFDRLVKEKHPGIWKRVNEKAMRRINKEHLKKRAEQAIIPDDETLNAGLARIEEEAAKLPEILREDYITNATNELYDADVILKSGPLTRLTYPLDMYRPDFESLRFGKAVKYRGGK